MYLYCPVFFVFWKLKFCHMRSSDICRGLFCEASVQGTGWAVGLYQRLYVAEALEKTFIIFKNPKDGCFRNFFFFFLSIIFYNFQSTLLSVLAICVMAKSEMPKPLMKEWVWNEVCFICMEAISNLDERQGVFGSKICVECLKFFMVHTTGLSAIFLQWFISHH